MSHELRTALDLRLREIWQVTKDWPERPSRLRAALEAAQQVVDAGLVEPLQLAREELEAAWAEAQPAALSPEPATEDL